MKIGLRGGHSPYAKGAVGIIDEQSNVRILSYKLKEILEKYGHTVIDCNSNASTVNGELNEGTNRANNNRCDIYIPLHMNAFNGSAQGVECIVYNTSSIMAVSIGKRVCNNLSSIGLINRGIKYNTGLHDLNATVMEACLIEILFCDNGHDVGIWNSLGVERFAYLIANAIDSSIPSSKPVPKPEPEKKLYYRVVCGSFIEKSNAEARQKELKAKGIGDSFIAIYKGSKTFYRVICGSFIERGNAEARQKELANKGFKDTFLDIYNK